MDNSLVLVTGAAGKTGEPVVRQLRERGVPVRALVRRLDHRSEALEALGAEVVVGDFFDVASLRSAVSGAERAYFCYPPSAGLLDATANFAIAARGSALRAVVNMSQLPAREGARSKLSTNHWQSEQILDWADIGAIHIRPTFFAEDLFLFTGGRVGQEGVLPLPWGSGRHAPLAGEDIARVVVSLLEAPAAHVGERYALTGAESVTMEEVALLLGEKLGHKVVYQDVPPELWQNALLESPFFDEYLADHLVAVSEDLREGVFDVQNDLVERITGEAAAALSSFIDEKREIFLAGRKQEQEVEACDADGDTCAA